MKWRYCCDTKTQDGFLGCENSRYASGVLGRIVVNCSLAPPRVYGVRMITAAVVFGAVLLLAVLMCRVIHRGMVCAASGKQNLLEHQRAATQALLATAFLIVVVEVFVQFSIEHTASWQLFVVHMSAAIPFLVLMITLRFWMNGLRYPRTHKLLAGVTTACFVGVLVTGLLLLGSATGIVM